MKKRNFYIKMITSSLVRRRSRMLVALLAVAVGATILSGLVTIYIDVPRQMGAQFRNYGANMILTPSTEVEGFSQAAIDEAVSVIPQDEVVGVAPYRYESVRVNGIPVVTAATDLAEVQATSPFWYVDGEWPAASGEILVGEEEADYFSLDIGDTVTLYFTPPESTEATAGSSAETVADYTMDFTVTGLLDTGGNEEQYFFISLDDLALLTQTEVIPDMAELSISAESASLEKYVTDIESAVPSVNASLVQRVTQSETTVLSKLQALVLLVTIIVVLLTAICVATTMTAVVTERRKEIGLRKALGASNKSITGEFMGEGILLGLVGGIIGALLGFLFAQIVSVNVFNSSITFQPWLLPVTIIAAVIITSVASLLPIRNATKVDPALVLKGE